MYAPNQTNSLYFHPHTLRFPALPAAPDGEQRNRWFPGYTVSVTSRRTKAPTLQSETVPETDLPKPDKGQADMRMEDDGSPSER